MPPMLAATVYNEPMIFVFPSKVERKICVDTAIIKPFAMPAATLATSSTLNCCAVKEKKVVIRKKIRAPINKFLLPSHFINTNPAMLVIIVPD